jgi:protein O-GlcNAc transferase
MGKSFANRSAQSLLNAIGLSELINQTQEDFKVLTNELAIKSGKLQSIKAKLEANCLTTPLFDAALLIQNLEVAYVQMCESYQADLLLEHMVVYITLAIHSSNSSKSKYALKIHWALQLHEENEIKDHA